MQNNYLNRPRYLAPLDGIKAAEDFSVLTDRETIRNLATNICNKLRHPVTILDVNRLGEVPTSELRIDSDIEYFSLRRTCRMLRHCAGLAKCHQCDEYHAAMLVNPGNDWHSQIGLALEHVPSFFYDEYQNNPPRVLTGFCRPILEYHCPILGYRELLFPLYYHGNVIGALHLGQTVVQEENDTEIIREIVNSFFSKPENHPETIFVEYLAKQGINPDDLSTEANKIKRVIEEADGYTEELDQYLRKPRSKNDIEFGQANMAFDTRAAYVQFIHDACAELDVMEKSLDSDVQEKQRRYFDTITREAVQTFFTGQVLQHEIGYTDIRAQRRMELRNAWDAFYAAAGIIREKLNLDEVLLFGDGIKVEAEENKRKQLYPLPSVSDPRYRWRYDFSKVEGKPPTDYDFICSLESSDLLEGLSRIRRGEMDISNSILLVYPNIAVLLQVRDRDENRSLYTEMAIAIGRSFSRIYPIIALCVANLMKERLLLALRMNRHESLHISTRLSDNMRRYFARDALIFTGLPPEKQRSVAEDMQNTIQLISHMASNIGLITGSINVDTISGQMKKIDMFALLYKWQIMFRDRLRDRNLELNVLRNDTDAPRFIATNPDLFELLVYNLVDNAVKYAHRGSNIRLAWWRSAYDSNSYHLTVSSYGPKIREEDRPFDLYARGDTSHLHPVEGDGIGLYVVKRVEELLGINVSYVCEQISPYNLPLVSWYLDEPFTDSTCKSKQMRLQEYKMGIFDFSWDDVVNDRAYTCITRRDLSKEYLRASIDRETWLTTFDVTVPNIKVG